MISSERSTFSGGHAPKEESAPLVTFAFAMMTATSAEATAAKAEGWAKVHPAEDKEEAKEATSQPPTEAEMAAACVQWRPR